MEHSARPVPVRLYQGSLFAEWREAPGKSKRTPGAPGRRPPPQAFIRVQ